MHQDFAQQPVGQMPQVTRPDALDGTAIDQLAKDGIDAVADATQPRAPAWVRVALGRAIGRQQLDAVAAPLSGRGGRGRPVIAVADQRPRRLLRQGRNHRQFMDIGGRDPEAGDDSRPFQPDMHAQAVKGLAHQRIFAERGLGAEPPTPVRPSKLADGQREAVDDGELLVMRHVPQHILPQPFCEPPELSQVGGLADKGRPMHPSERWEDVGRRGHSAAGSKQTGRYPGPSPGIPRRLPWSAPRCPSRLALAPARAADPHRSRAERNGLVNPTKDGDNESIQVHGSLLRLVATVSEESMPAGPGVLRSTKLAHRVN
jgi:hypothetical protein